MLDWRRLSPPVHRAQKSPRVAGLGLLGSGRRRWAGWWLWGWWWPLQPVLSRQLCLLAVEVWGVVFDHEATGMARRAPLAIWPA